VKLTAVSENWVSQQTDEDKKKDVAIKWLASSKVNK